MGAQKGKGGQLNVLLDDIIHKSNFFKTKKKTETNVYENIRN